MKRFLNVYSLAIDFCITIDEEDKSDYAPEKHFDLADLFAIELVKYLSEPIYRELRDHDNNILVLSKADNLQKHKTQLYSLKENDTKWIQEIVYDDKLLEDSVKRLSRKGKGGNSPTNENKSSNSEERKTFLMNFLANTKSDLVKKCICYLLYYLFIREELKENSLRYKDAYFRYFSYRIKNDQMSVNEALEIISISDMDSFKNEIKRVFNEGKQQSFIHKTSFIKNPGSSDVSIVEKLFLFVDKAKEQIITEELECDDKEEQVCDEYNIFDILFYWYEKRNYDGKDVEELALKKNMCDFINNDPHLNLLFLFLKDMVYYNEKKRLVFTNAELYDWCSQLLYRFFKEKPSNEKSKKELKNMLSRSMYIKPIDVKWLASLVQQTESHFTWNDRYIKYLFQTKSELINFLPVFESPEIKDLKELLELEEISSCTVEDHPFLEMCKELGAENDEKQKNQSNVSS